LIYIKSDPFIAIYLCSEQQNKRIMATQLHTQIRINATPQQVWSVFSDFETYPHWNPFIKKVNGNMTPGSKLGIRLEQPGSKGMNIAPALLAFEPAKELRWLGHLLVPGIFDGEHCFELKDNGDGSTTFIQRENFKGILVPLLRNMLDTKTRAGFELMNQALKARVENQFKN